VPVHESLYFHRDLYALTAFLYDFAKSTSKRAAMLQNKSAYPEAPGWMRRQPFVDLHQVGVIPHLAIS
jgi:hypothetical protein